MTWFFADSFDLYATTTDAVANKWDSGGTSLFGLTTGRFTGGRAIATSTLGVYLTKSSGVNEAVHHITCAFQTTVALSGTGSLTYFQLLDGATGQCCIVFRSDGAILLTSGTTGGTTLATYTGAVTAQSTWVAFEFEVVIHNTTGSFTVRTQGAGSTSFTATGLNTRGGTANNYANKLSYGSVLGTNGVYLDDLIWRSDPTALTWLGDQRAYILYPVSDSSKQFSPMANPVSVAQTSVFNATASKASGLGAMSAFTASYSGTIASGTVSIATGGTGNMKAAIYDATRVNVLATSNAVVNPGAGLVAITFGTPLTVTKGTVYYLAVDQDFTIIYNSTGSANCTFSTAYASFPATSPTVTQSQPGPCFYVNITPSTNAEFVQETVEDTTTSYVYDATVGHADLYAVGALPTSLVAPSGIAAVVTRMFAAKSDAGARSAQVQLKSGGTTVQSTALALSTSFQWTERVDLVDPNTAATWTNANVNAVTIGPLVQA